LIFLTDWPMERPQNWIEFVNAPDNASKVNHIDRVHSAETTRLESTMKSSGRPKRAGKDLPSNGRALLTPRPSFTDALFTQTTVRSFILDKTEAYSSIISE
jgi:hypothetical protein